MKRIIAILGTLGLVVGLVVGPVAASTIVRGHQQERFDTDNNGYPDVGVTVNGKYTSLYAYDASGDWYWNLGDGRVYGSVGSIDDLDQATLSRCDYQVQYRGRFDNTPFLNSGWIMNNIICTGYDGTVSYNYVIVHQTDPRYRGNPDWAIWGAWEYHTLTVSGYGNLVRPMNYTG